MNQYTIEPISTIDCNGISIPVFEIGDDNIDKITVESFGDEWSKFSNFSVNDIKNAGGQYFDIVTDKC